MTDRTEESFTSEAIRTRGKRPLANALGSIGYSVVSGLPRSSYIGQP